MDFINYLDEVNPQGFVNAFEEIKQAHVDEIFKNASESCKKFGADLKTTAKSYDEAAAQSKKFIQNQHDAMLKMNAFGKVVKGVGAAFKTVAAAALNMLIITAIIAVIEKLVNALDKMHMSAAEAAEATERAVTTFETQRSEIEGNISTIESLSDRYSELSRGVNELGENVALSAEDYAEYKDIVQQIVGLTPSVIQGYNDEGDAILDRNNLIRESIDLLKQQRIEQAKTAVFGTEGNDGGKSNLAAAVIDYENNYRKQTNEATAFAKSFSDELAGIADSIDESKAAEFQKVIEKHAGTKLSDIKPILPYHYYGTLDKTATIYDLLSQKSDILASHSKELVTELTNLGITSEGAASKASLLGDSYDVAMKEVEATSSGIISMMGAVLESEEAYYSLSEGSQSFLKNLIAGMDTEQLNNLVGTGADGIATAMRNMLNAVASDPDVQAAISQLTSLRADTSNISATDYIALEKELTSKIRAAFENIPGIDVDALLNVNADAQIDAEAMADSIKSQVENEDVINRIMGMSVDEMTFIYQYGLKDIGKMSLEEFENWYKRIRNQASKPIEVKVGIADVQDDLSDLSETFDSLGSIISDFEEYQVIDTDSLGALIDKFKSVEGVDIEGYANSISEAGITTAQLKAETDKLVSSILLQNDAFRNVNEATANNVAAALENKGVTNARALVTAQLKANLEQEAIAEYEAANGALAFGDAESMNIDTLIAVAEQLGVTKAAMFQYVLQKINANAVTISTNGDIANVMALANACGVGTKAVATFIKAKQMASHFQSLSASAVGTWGEDIGNSIKADYDIQAAHYAGLAEKAFDDINATLTSGAINSACGVNYGGNVRNSGSGSGGGNGGSGKSESDKYSDWVNEQLEIMQHQIDVWNKNGGFEKFGTEIIAQYQKMQDFVHKAANHYRKLGLGENSEEIRAMQQKWLEYRDSVRDIYKGIYDIQKQSADDSIEILEKQYDQMEQQLGISYAAFKDIADSGISIPVTIDDTTLDATYDKMLSNIEERIKLQQQIMADAHAEANRYRKLGYSETSPEIRDMQKTYLDAQAAITELKRVAAENLIGQFDEFIELADKFDRWDNLKTNKLDILRRKLEHINQALADGLITLAEYKEMYTDTAGEIYETQKDAIDYVIDLTKDMLKQQQQDEIDALNEQNDLYQEKVDLIKESLRLTTDENDHNREVEKKLKEIAKIQSKIDQLSLDDGRESVAKRAELAEHLAELQDELAQLQYDRGVEIQEEALDKESENFQKANEDKIDKLEDQFKSEQLLHDAAIKYIDENYSTLYDQLLAYNLKYGQDLQDTVISKWEIAKQAVDRYGQSVKDALQGIENENFGGGANESGIRDILSEMISNAQKWAATSDAGERKTLSDTNEQLAKELAQYGINARKDSASGTWYIRNSGNKLFDLLTNPALMAQYAGSSSSSSGGSSGSSSSSSSGGNRKDAEERARKINARILNMKGNASAWKGSDEAGRKELSRINERLSEEIKALGLPVEMDSRGAEWHVGSESGPLLYDLAGDITGIVKLLKYHSGGIAGSLKPNEVVAVLEKGEAIYTEEQNAKLARIVEMQQKLASVLPLGASFTPSMNDSFSALRKLSAGLQRPQPSEINFAPEINIRIDGAQNDAALVRKVRDSVLDAVNSAFVNSGIGSGRMQMKPV